MRSHRIGAGGVRVRGRVRVVVHGRTTRGKVGPVVRLVTVAAGRPIHRFRDLGRTPGLTPSHVRHHRKDRNSGYGDQADDEDDDLERWRAVAATTITSAERCCLPKLAVRSFPASFAVASRVTKSGRAGKNNEVRYQAAGLVEQNQSALDGELTLRRLGLCVYRNHH